MAKEVYREINRYNPYTGQTDTYMGTWEDYCKYMPDKDFKNPEPVYNPTLMQQARYAMSSIPVPETFGNTRAEASPLYYSPDMTEGEYYRANNAELANSAEDRTTSLYDSIPEYLKYAMFGPAGMIAYSGKKAMNYFDNPNMRY